MERNLDINTVLPSSVQMTNTQETMLSRRGNNKRQKPENRTPQRFSPQLMKSYWCLAHPVSVVSFVTSFSAPSHRPLRQRIYRSRQRGSYHKALECTDQNTNLMFILNVTTETFIVQGCTWLVIFFSLIWRYKVSQNPCYPNITRTRLPMLAKQSKASQARLHLWRTHPGVFRSPSQLFSGVPEMLVPRILSFLAVYENKTSRINFLVYPSGIKRLAGRVDARR